MKPKDSSENSLGSSQAGLSDLVAQLRELRAKAGLTVREAASRTGLSTGYISQVERGLLSIRRDALIKLAQAYNSPVGELLRYAGLLEEQDAYLPVDTIRWAHNAVVHDPRLGDPELSSLLMQIVHVEAMALAVELYELKSGNVLLHEGERVIALMWIGWPVERPKEVWELFSSDSSWLFYIATVRETLRKRNIAAEAFEEVLQVASLLRAWQPKKWQAPTNFPEIRIDRSRLATNMPKPRYEGFFGQALNEELERLDGPKAPASNSDDPISPDLLNPPRRKLNGEEEKTRIELSDRLAASPPTGGTLDQYMRSLDSRLSRIEAMLEEFKK